MAYPQLNPKQVPQYRPTQSMLMNAQRQGLQQHIIPFMGGLYAAAGNKVAPYVNPSRLIQAYQTAR